MTYSDAVRNIRRWLGDSESIVSIEAEVERLASELGHALAEASGLTTSLAAMEAEVDLLTKGVLKGSLEIADLRAERAASREEAKGLREALAEVEAAMTWALDKSPEACQAMAEESAPWRIKARAALKGKP